jgi:SulP family sulfate permease
MKHVHDLDATTALAVRQLKDFLTKSGRHLIVYSVPSHVLKLLENVQLLDHLGQDNVIPFDAKAPHTALEEALNRARILLEQEAAAQGQI